MWDYGPEMNAIDSKGDYIIKFVRSWSALS
jgi:hypothetical protein